MYAFVPAIVLFGAVEIAVRTARPDLVERNTAYRSRFYPIAPTATRAGAFDLLDLRLWRATSRTQDAQRAFADRYGLPVVDLPALLAAASPGMRVGCNLFGNETYCDHLHPNAKGHAITVQALAMIIAERR